MHKSKGNFIEFNEAADKAGVDVLRWVYCRHNPELDLWFGYTVCDEVRRSFYLTLWNSYKYLVTYANINNWKPSSKNIYKMKLKELDRWILSRLNHTLSSVDASLKEYDPVRSTQEIEKLVEDLSTWYIRRSRDRFVAKDEVAIEVLYFVLYNLTKVLMPFMPFISEEMWANLKGASDPEYACLVDYPEYSEKFIDQKLEDEMAVVRRIASLGLSARIAGKLKVRQPLSGIVVSGVKTISEKMAEILKSELNVMSIEVKKEIPVTPDYVSAEDTEMKVALDTKMTEELKSEGLWREFLRKVQQARKNGGLEVGEQVTLVLATDREDLHLLVSSREKELLAAVSVNKLEFVSADKAPKTTKGKISVTIE
jgi:isoleucyl-tRNA synthetase